MRCVSAVRLCSPGLVLLLALSGCATLFSAGPDRIPITTNPQGATVFVDNLPVGQTPLLVALDREHSSGVIRIELAGFAPIMMMRSKSINGWFWVNLCTTGLIGIVVDLATGNVQGFDDDPIAIGLTPIYDPQGGAPPPGYGPSQGPSQGPGAYPPAAPYPPAPTGTPPPPPSYPPPPR